MEALSLVTTAPIPCVLHAQLAKYIRQPRTNTKDAILAKLESMRQIPEHPALRALPDNTRHWVRSSAAPVLQESTPKKTQILAHPAEPESTRHIRAQKTAATGELLAR